MKAYIGLGSNLGDREGMIREALRLLGMRVRLLRVAGIRETEALVPSGEPPAPAYLNTVCEIESALAPRALLDLCASIERELGRERSPGRRWESRTIDLDLLLCGEAVLHEPDLYLPHPELPRRKFVLEPLAELAPDLRHPENGSTVREMLEALS